MSAPERTLARRVGIVVRDVLEAVILAVFLFLVLQLFMQNTVVEGMSMQPNFDDREHLLVNKIAYRMGEPARGDVVVFHAPGAPGKDFIKRVIALPGETVALQDGVVLIDNAPLDEPWNPRLDASRFGPYVVPEGYVFVLGDNRANSNDSRVFGDWGASYEAGPAVPLDLVVGRAWLSVWPIAELGMVHPDQPGPGARAPRPSQQEVNGR